MWSHPTSLRLLRRSIAPELMALSLLLAVSATGHAEQDPRYRAIQDLGALNGVALQCRYIDQVRRMKQAVVSNAPKERSFGLAFDEATNKAFLAFIERQESCPQGETFARSVGHQIDRVRTVFAAE